MQAAEQVLDADLAADLALLLDAAKEAGRIALRYFGKAPEVWLKEGASPVSEADYAADRFLREELLAARPDYGWLSEETVDGPARLEARRTFIVDPIDGTRGFLAGKDQWCVSAAIVEAGRPLVGVLECPAKRETFHAQLGAGAQKNGRMLSVGAARPTHLVGGPVSMMNRLPPDLRAKVHRSQYVPSLAYRIAMVSDGSLDATFVKPNSRDWDLAAADLILHEAGGAIVDERGLAPVYGARDTAHGSLVAGNGELLAEMLRSIQAEARDPPVG